MTWHSFNSAWPITRAERASLTKKDTRVRAEGSIECRAAQGLEHRRRWEAFSVVAYFCCFLFSRIELNCARDIFKFSGCSSIHLARASYLAGGHPPSNSAPFFPRRLSSKLKASSRLVNSAETIAGSARIAGIKLT